MNASSTRLDAKRDYRASKTRLTEKCRCQGPRKDILELNLDSRTYVGSISWTTSVDAREIYNIQQPMAIQFPLKFNLSPSNANINRIECNSTYRHWIQAPNVSNQCQLNLRQRGCVECMYVSQVSCTTSWLLFHPSIFIRQSRWSQISVMQVSIDFIIPCSSLSRWQIMNHELLASVSYNSEWRLTSVFRVVYFFSFWRKSNVGKIKFNRRFNSEAEWLKSTSTHQRPSASKSCHLPTA